MPLPGEKHFFDKLVSAVRSDDKLMREYFARFDAYHDSAFPERSLDRILIGLACYGGYHARVRLINSIPVDPSSTVLDIGPEMGIECLLLAELYRKVLVAEPDSRTCAVLRKLSCHYLTEDGRKASDILDVRQCGIIPEGAKSLSITPGGKTSGIYAFNAEGAKDISGVFGTGFAGRVYCNHLVKVMPQEPELDVLLGGLASYCRPEGTITWTDSIPEMAEALNLHAVNKDCADSPVAEIERRISCLLPGFNVSFKVLQKPRQLLTVAGRICGPA